MILVELVEDKLKIQDQAKTKGTMVPQATENNEQFKQTEERKTFLKNDVEQSESNEDEEIIVEPIISMYCQNGTKTEDSDDDIECDIQSLEYPSSDTSNEDATVEEQSRLRAIGNKILKPVLHINQLTVESTIEGQQITSVPLEMTDNLHKKVVDWQNDTINQQKILPIYDKCQQRVESHTDNSQFEREDIKDDYAHMNLETSQNISFKVGNNEKINQDKLNKKENVSPLVKESCDRDESEQGALKKTIIGDVSTIQDNKKIETCTELIESNTETSTFTQQADFEEVGVKSLVQRMRKKYRTAKRYPTYKTKIKKKKKKITEKPVEKEIVDEAFSSSTTKALKSVETLPFPTIIDTTDKRRTPHKSKQIKKKNVITKAVKKEMIDKTFNLPGSSSQEDTCMTKETSKLIETLPLIQTKIEGYCCSNCGLVYQHKATLKRHQIYECGKEPKFFCYLCDYKGKHKGSLKKHIENKHVPKAYKPRKRGRPKQNKNKKHKQTELLKVDSDDEYLTISEIQNNEKTKDNEQSENNGKNQDSYKKSKGSLRLVRKIKEEVVIPKEIEKTSNKRKRIKKEHDPDYIHY